MIIFWCPGHLLPAGKPQRTHKGLQSWWDQGVCFTKPFESNLSARTSPWWLLCYRKKGKPGNSLVKCFLWFSSWTSRTTQCFRDACVAEEAQWVGWRWAGARRPEEPLTLYRLRISLAHYHVFHYCFMSVSVILPQWLCGDLILSDTISSLLIKDPTSSLATEGTEDPGWDHRNTSALATVSSGQNSFIWHFQSWERSSLPSLVRD